MITKKSGLRKFLLDQNSLLVLLLFIVLGAIVFDKFFTVKNLTNVMRQASFNGIIAIGMTVVILTGGIDLSVGSIFAMSGVLISYLQNQSLFVILLVPLIAGLVMGLLNGLSVSKLKIAPFITTLATMMAYRGIIFLLTDGGITRSIKNEAFEFIGRGELWDVIPIPALLFVILTLLFMFLLKFTKYGRRIYAFGGNNEAAKMMGVNVSRIEISAYAINGVMAAFAGIIMASRMGSGEPVAGKGYELEAIAATVLGGTSLLGGVGKISGTFYGTLILAIINNLINMQGNIDARVRNVIMGVILLAVVIIQSRINTTDGGTKSCQ